VTNWAGFTPGETWIPTMGTASGYWTSTSLPTVAFSGTQYSYQHVWSQWGTYAWASIQSSGLLWEQLAGYTFITSAAKNNTTWS